MRPHPPPPSFWHLKTLGWVSFRCQNESVSQGRAIIFAMDLDEMRSLAELQHGVVARRQVGPSTSAKVEREIRSKRWEPLYWGVYRLRGSPPTEEQRVTAAVLRAGPGALASHSSAAALWNLPGYDLGHAEVTRLRATRSSTVDGIIVHEPRKLLAGHVTSVSRITVSTPARTLFDLAGREPSGRMARLVDRCLSRGLTTTTALQRTLDELAQRGRPGIRTMRTLLAERPVGYVAPQSGLETRMAWILRHGDLPPFERQVDLGGEQWIGRVDFVNLDLGLVIEVQSEAFHAALTDQLSDARRTAALRDLGLTVVEVWDHEIWHDAPVVRSRVDDAVRIRRSGTRKPARGSRSGARTHQWAQADQGSTRSGSMS